MFWRGDVFPWEGAGAGGSSLFAASSVSGGREFPSMKHLIPLAYLTDIHLAGSDEPCEHVLQIRSAAHCLWDMQIAAQRGQ